MLLYYCLPKTNKQTKRFTGPIQFGEMFLRRLDCVLYFTPPRHACSFFMFHVQVRENFQHCPPRFSVLGAELRLIFRCRLSYSLPL